MNRLRFCLNGEWVEETQLSPSTTLLRYLRDVRAMTGTKEGCAEGDCGACTVCVVEDGPNGPEFRAVNSCLLLLPMVQGKRVLTVEGLKRNGAAHPVQLAMTQALGSQCGYCTPGFVMSMFEAAHRTDVGEPWQLDDQLCGNLCRCTGYRPIRAAAQQVVGKHTRDGLEAELRAPESMELDYQHGPQRFLTPVSLDALWALFDAHPGARVVAGGTDLSLEVTKKFARPELLISLEALPELRGISTVNGVTRIGAAVTLAELEAFAQHRVAPLARMVRYFGARQIKHRGTVGGNLCNASPIGDLPPVLIALSANAVLSSRRGERRLPLDQFFVGYRKTALEPGEILSAVELPALEPSTLACAYKVSKRRELDISTVSAAFVVKLDAARAVTHAVLAYGGVAATPKRAAKAEASLIGKPWSEANVERACEALSEDFQPLSDHRGSKEYRSKLVANLLRGFWLETQHSAQPPLAAEHTATVQPEV